MAKTIEFDSKMHEDFNARFLQMASARLKKPKTQLEGCVLTGESDYKPSIFIPTSIKELDAILGKGGVPRGNGIIGEFVGEEHSGKTHTAICLAASNQKTQDRPLVGWLNPEASFYPERASALGLDINKLHMLQGLETAEQYGGMLVDMAESGMYGFIIVDSISALVPDVDYDKDLADNAKIGAHATFVNRLCKRLLSPCLRTGTSVILINQFRNTSGPMPNSFIKDNTGGRGLKYFKHLSLAFSRVGGKEGKVLSPDGKNQIGGYTRVSIPKNRFGKPYAEAVFPIFFEKGAVNPLGEFLFRAVGKKWLSTYYKEYRYIDPSTGEMLVVSKDPAEFVQMLMEAPAPAKLVRGDQSRTGFEWVCGRLKMEEPQREAVLEALREGRVDDIAMPEEAPEIALGNVENAAYLEGIDYDPSDDE